MGKFRDLTGLKIGRWTVLSRGPNGPQKQTTWNCVCECGTERNVRAQWLTEEGERRSRSCGCLSSDLASERLFKHGKALSTKYNHSNEKIYRIWSNMKSRCLNENNPAYYRYGGKGILICDRWLDFKNFLEDMGDAPFGNLSIDRINTLGNYEPSNCRWADGFTQAMNQKKVKPESGVRGVCVKQAKKGIVYVASLTYKKKYYYLGTYDNLEDAKSARLKAEIDIVGYNVQY